MNMPSRNHLPTRIKPVAILLIAFVGILTATFAPIAFAHEGREVGDYNLVVGFLREPAYEGQLNAVSLVVTKPPTEAPADDADAEPEDDHHAEPADNDHHADDATNTEAVDVTVYGAIFTSPQIGMKENFELEISDELGGIEIPYHVHPGDQEGVIVVSSMKADHGLDRSIEIMDDHVVPDRLEVNIGDTVVWVNQESHSAVVMSGTLSPVTTDMTTKMVDDALNVADEPAAASDRVSGLASNLQVEIIHVSTNISRAFPLTELVDDPGHYVAEFVPTAPGDYRVRFFGSIEGNAIDETFDSGPDTFDTVIASDAIQFPVVLESNREIQNATRGALEAVQELETDLEATSSTASTGMVIGIVGIVFGAIATGFSVFAITIARRRN